MKRKKSLFPNAPKTKNSMRGVEMRGTDASGMTLGRTISLSTPIVSVQDGPRMTLATTGKPLRAKKRALAKAVLKKAQGADLSNTDIDLGRFFNRNEPRDRIGRWVKGPGAIKAAMESAPAGSEFHIKNVRGVKGLGANDRVYTKNFGGTLEGKVKTPEGQPDLPIGRHTPDQASRRLHREAKALMLSPAEVTIRKDQAMEKRDAARLAAASARKTRKK